MVSCLSSSPHLLFRSLALPLKIVKASFLLEVRCFSAPVRLFLSTKGVPLQSTRHVSIWKLARKLKELKQLKFFIQRLYTSIKEALKG